MTIVYLSAVIITPLFGMMVDREGKRGLVLVFSSFLLIGAFILIITLENPIQNELKIMVPLFSIGIAYS